MSASQDPKPDFRPLNDEEHKAFDIISQKIQRQLASKPADTRPAAEAILKEAVEIMGARGYLDSILVPPQIMGVPYEWFVVNALICLMGFILTNNFIVLFFIAPVIHAIGYVYCQPRLKRQREESIQKLLHGS